MSLTLSALVVLRDEVLGGARDAVLVRPAVDDGQLLEVAVSGRRAGGGPLERRRLPVVGLGLGAVLQAPEEVEDERDLREGQSPREVRRHLVVVEHRLGERVGRAAVGQPARHPGEAR